MYPRDVKIKIYDHGTLRFFLLFFNCSVTIDGSLVFRKIKN